MMSTASLTCCVVAAGPKVSTVLLTVPIRTWELFKNLNIFRASSGHLHQPVGGAVA